MSVQDFRTSDGGRIERGKSIRFVFNGRTYAGHPGDTLASALLANGVHFVGRSFKYHRPRGIMAAGAEEPNAMVQLGEGATTEPNPKATQIELYDGLKCESVNAWPSLGFDIQALNGVFSRFFPAGFYYKTMFSSPVLWHRVFEPMIRRAAGWGKAPKDPDPDCYDHKHVFCDVLIVGGGAAGLSAALTAARSGARVILADEQSEIGGALLSQNRRIGAKTGAQWLKEKLKTLSKTHEALLLSRTTVFGYYDDNYLLALERRTDHTGARSSPANPRLRIWHIRARQVVLATGAHERPLVFADNDRPGVMLASAAQTYLNRYGVRPGNASVIFTNNDSAYETAIDLHNAGGTVIGIIDLRREPTGELVERARALGLRIYEGFAITEVKGRTRVRSITVRRFDGEHVAGQERALTCDSVLVSGGWNPVTHLYCQAQGKLNWLEDKLCFQPVPGVKGCQVAGAANALFGLKQALESGAAAGAAAARDTGFKATRSKPPKVDEPDTGLPDACWLVPTNHAPGIGKAKHFLDFQNDSTAGDILLAVREGFASVEHMKRYTLTGFGTDQGKLGNVNALAFLSQTLGQSVGETGFTTFRPPYTPVTFGALAGRELGDFLDPIRVTSIHKWHEENGAVYEDVGQWKRPWYFPREGEDMHAAVMRECLAVRRSVGILDASTLGKIDIQGKDAAEFLNRIYTNAWSKLGIGKCRYGLMCKEDGMVFDDGVTARLGENHFHMTTTTGGAAGVLDWLEEYHQTEWPHLKVYFTSVTEHWATLSIAGPNARQLMQTCFPDSDWSNEAFAFMSVQEHALFGIPARVFRISFTGEVSFEINVPSRFALAVWRRIFEAGKAFDITPYGTETMHVLRAEKGFIIVGQETDGTQTPFDLGMDWIVSKNKPDFIGKRSYARPDTARKDRKQLVGLLTEDKNFVLDEGAQIIETPTDTRPVPMLGHVTSSYFSPVCGHSIALALIKNARARMDETLYAFSKGQTQKVKVTSPVFYDPKGERING